MLESLSLLPTKYIHGGGVQKLTNSVITATNLEWWMYQIWQKSSIDTQKCPLAYGKIIGDICLVDKVQPGVILTTSVAQPAQQDSIPENVKHYLNKLPLFSIP